MECITTGQEHMRELLFEVGYAEEQTEWVCMSAVSAFSSDCGGGDPAVVPLLQDKKQEELIQREGQEAWGQLSEAEKEAIRLVLHVSCAEHSLANLFKRCDKVGAKLLREELDGNADEVPAKLKGFTVIGAANPGNQAILEVCKLVAPHTRKVNCTAACYYHSNTSFAHYSRVCAAGIWAQRYVCRLGDDYEGYGAQRHQVTGGDRRCTARLL